MLHLNEFLKLKPLNSHQRTVNRLAYTHCTRAEILKPHFLVFTLNPECTKDACSPPTVEAPSSILTELNRTFTWKLNTPEKTFVGLNILGEGLIETSQPCPDGFQYLTTSKTVETQYCRGGSVTRFDLPSEATVSLQVKPNAQIPPVLFQASAGPLSKNQLLNPNSF